MKITAFAPVFLGTFILSACSQGSSLLPSPSVSPTLFPTPAPTQMATPLPTASGSPQPIYPVGQSQIISDCDGSALIFAADERIIMTPCPPDMQVTTPEVTLQIAASEHPALKQKYDLFAVNPAPAYLGSLSPQVAFASGLKAQCGSEQGVVFNGGLLGSCTLYPIQTEQGDALINSKASLKARFAPIDSTEEAASYALAATGKQFLTAFKDLSPDFRFYQKRIQRSGVQISANDFQVLLYDYQQFGCGPHPYDAVVYQVSRDGQIKEFSRQPAWADPNQDNLCID